MTQLDPWFKAIGRVLLSLIYVWSGAAKLIGYAGTAQYMESKGVPGLLLPLVILTELGGGLAVLVGWQTRWAALALAGFTLLAALLFHFDFGDRMQSIQFMKNLGLAGGFLLLAAAGPGALSLDGKK
ncbi:MAG: DoxX family protein [Pseudomonadota bacterium]|nr:DoxX family protein [Pseudomonadota bacterium]